MLGLSKPTKQSGTKARNQKDNNQWSFFSPDFHWNKEKRKKVGEYLSKIKKLISFQVMDELIKKDETVVRDFTVLEKIGMVPFDVVPVP